MSTGSLKVSDHKNGQASISRVSSRDEMVWGGIPERVWCTDRGCQGYDNVSGRCGNVPEEKAQTRRYRPLVNFITLSRICAGPIDPEI